MVVVCSQNGRIFEKLFDSFYKAQKFIKACERGNKIQILSYYKL